ncbi:Ig-like domain-containing protein [Gordonia sp. ABSL1-1]|uniref:L,D-transpeptidase n=1 Tax=Gordonia sp. ABSL1-1 TaxID=3053923 RepID=UPI00257284BE|nr:Ig-like domain-containing protein [Gordonia sp. ABSL1-1]MDL9938515.1 Ig-like domain-containing protein [Gordonia sp. ABSL1-1]
MVIGRARRGSVLAGAAVLAVVGLVTSCSSQEPKYPTNVQSANLIDDLLQPGLDFSIFGEGQGPLHDKAVGVQPGAPITVQASDGAISSVVIKKSNGEPVRGELSEDGTQWVKREPLGYNKSYTLVAEARGVGGTSVKQVTFTTSAPNNLTQAYVTPTVEDRIVGVGQPVAVKFDESIPDRKAAERAIRIKTEPAVDGAFYWISDTEVRWRPEKFWKTGTKVKVEVNTEGIDLGDGLFGQENVKREFTIGRSMIITADDHTKQVVFKRDGKVIKTMPTSMGKPGAETDNGIYLVSDKHEHIIMDSSTYGVPINSADGYRTPVDYATRMSYSGIFFHSAPWSVWAQGNTNTSHGCLNLSPDNALWVMQNTLRGDPVVVRNTDGGTLPVTDGLGDWNIDWAKWKKGNADG